MQTYNNYFAFVLHTQCTFESQTGYSDHRSLGHVGSKSICHDQRRNETVSPSSFVCVFLSFSVPSFTFFGPFFILNILFPSTYFLCSKFGFNNSGRDGEWMEGPSGEMKTMNAACGADGVRKEDDRYVNEKNGSPE